MKEEIVKRRGLMKKHAVVDHEVWLWKTKLEHTRRLTKTEIQAYAVQAYRNVGIDNFKASNGWYRRWRLRWAKPGVVERKDAKGNEDFEKAEELESNTKSYDCCELLPRSKPEQFSDIQLTQNSSTSNIFLEDLNKIGNELENRDEKLNQYDFSNKLGLFNVKSTNTNEHSDKMIHKSTNINEINRDVEELQSKNLVVYDTIETDSTIFNSIDPRLSESINHDLIILQTNESEKHVSTSSKHTEHNISEISTINHAGNIESMEPVLSRPVVLIKNTTKSTNNSMEDTNYYPAQPFHITPTTSVKEINTGLQSLTPSTISLEPFSATTSLLEHRDLDFGDDELFCDSCEDFHPRKKGLYTNCCKQKKGTSFLRSVFEIKDQRTVTNTFVGNSDEGSVIKERNNELNIEEKKVKSQAVVLAKGKRYLTQFKSKVVNYALNHNAKQAAAFYKVNRNTVSEWLDERKRSFDFGDLNPRSIESLSSSDDSEFLSWLESSKFNLTNELIKNKAGEWLKLESSTRSKCGWLRLYAHRINGTEDSAIKKRYIAYPEAFKRMVVFHAQTHTNKAAARVFGVARRRVVQWQQIFNETRTNLETTTTRNVTDEVVDKELFKWFKNQNPPPSSKQVKNKGLELYRAAGYHNIQCGAQWYYRWRARYKLPPASDTLHKEEPLISWALAQLDNNQCVTHLELAQAYTNLTHSKVSRGWTFRFCRKYHRLLQSVPEPSVVLPITLEQQVTHFRQTLQDTVQKENFIESYIVAMDEVPLHFHPKDSSRKPLLVRRPGFENCQASLIISSLADGTLLPTMFVFKGVAPSCSVDSCVVPVANDSGLVSDDVMIQWITNVYSAQLQGRRSILITDCFDIHKSKEAQQTMENLQVHHAVIPEGCSIKLLPTIRICQLFKRMLEDMCQASMANQGVSLSSPSPDQIYLWSVRVHKHLAKHQKESIKADFKEMLFDTRKTSI